MGPSDATPALRQMLRRLQQMSGQLNRILTDLDSAAADPAHAFTGVPRTEAIVRLLQARAEPMSPVEIWRALHDAGSRDEKNLIQVTTYQLWRRGRLAKVGRGRYCHWDHVPQGSPLERPPAGTGPGP